MAKNKEEKSTKDTSQVILEEIMEKGKDHFNFIEAEDYRVSTGSLNFDLETGGGIGPGIIRATGMSESGKSSFSLNLAKNFLEDANAKKPRKGIYFLSDKDISNEMIKRTGLKFAETIEEWVDGSLFILRTNVYEMVCNTIKKVIESKKHQFVFILDSMDNFSPKSALEVDFGESFQKGGTSAISAHFFRSFNILLPRLGHLTILISQYRDTIQINKYNPIQKQTNSSGGRAIEHAVSWAFELSPPMNSKEDMFWEGDPYKSKKTGHNCIVQLKKTTNEKTGTKLKYPIIYGRGPGKSIWVEREIFDQLLIWSLLKKKGAWLELDEDLHKEIQNIDKEFPKITQGQDTFVKSLELKPKITEFLYDKFRAIITQNK